MVMYPFYIFVAALIVFLLYNYRQVIKEKLGYHDGEKILKQSVNDLQLELRGTADAIIEQFEREHKRMEITLAKAAERISELEKILQTAGTIQRQTAKNIAFLNEQEKLNTEKADNIIRPEHKRMRIVSQMAEHGMDIFEISQATGLGYSEVRLLLNIGRTGPRPTNLEPGTVDDESSF
jgi:hypothetical protein